MDGLETPNECDVLDCDSLCNVLTQISGSLESLTLSVGISTHNRTTVADNIAWGIAGSLGSMKHFRKLTYLKAPLPMLVGQYISSQPHLDQILPSDLRELCLTKERNLGLSIGWSDRDVLARFCLSYEIVVGFWRR